MPHTQNSERNKGPTTTPPSEGVCRPPVWKRLDWAENGMDRQNSGLNVVFCGDLLSFWQNESFKVAPLESDDEKQRFEKGCI